MTTLALLVHPLQLGYDPVWLLLPLLAVVGAVYKAIRVRHLRALPLQILILWAYMAVGLVILAAAFYILVEHFI